MAKEFLEVNGRYYFVDDVTGKISQFVIKGEVMPPPEDLAEILKLLTKKDRS
jgi:hypothetical protein